MVFADVFLRSRVERIGRIIAYSLDDAETFGAAFTEEDAVADGKVLGPLHEAEGYCCAITGPDEGAVNVDDGARLRDGTHVQHGLVFGLDGGGVTQDEY